MTCNSFLKPLADWAQGPLEHYEHRWLDLVLVSNDKDGPARYAEGRLTPSPPLGQSGPFLGGDADLYQSDARWGSPSPHPFSPEHIDKIQVTIDVLTGQIRLTSATRGTAVIDNPQCDEFLLFGFATSGGGQLGFGGSRLEIKVNSNHGNVRAPGNGGPGNTQPGPIGGPGPVHPGSPGPVQQIQVRPYYVISLTRHSDIWPE